MNEPIEIQFYPQLSGDNVIMGVLQNQQMCLFSTKRIESIFKKKADFIAR
jgi:hypothetical protein